jgi:putative transposase
VVGPQLRREAVLVMQVEVELSQRRACGLMELYRGTCRYRRRRAEDGRLRTRMRELAEARSKVAALALNRTNCLQTDFWAS